MQSNNNRCNFTSCRFNAEGICENEEAREECVEMSRKVMCLDEEVVRIELDEKEFEGLIKNMKPISAVHIGDNRSTCESSELLDFCASCDKTDCKYNRDRECTDRTAFKQCEHVKPSSKALADVFE